MFIPGKNDFQPSPEALNLWLSTRKSNINIGGVSMPRFFSDTGNSADSNWFYLACFGEALGLGSTIYGGMRSGGIFLIFATLCIAMFIICDFFFAVKLHRNKAKICKNESLVLLKDDSINDHSKIAAEILKLRLEIEQGKFSDFLLQTGIIFIAFVKVIGIVLLGVFNNLVLYLPFAIIYFIVAYVHIAHTGYYFAYKATQKKINSDYLEFATGEHIAKEMRQLISTPSILNHMPIKHNPHEIVKNLEEVGESNYIIKAKGLLTDEDIQNLVDGQNNSNKISLFRACRQLQVESL